MFETKGWAPGPGAHKMTRTGFPHIRKKRECVEPGSDFLPIVLVRRSTVELEAGRPGQAGDDALRALKQLQAASPDGMLSSNIGRASLPWARIVPTPASPAGWRSPKPKSR